MAQENCKNAIFLVIVYNEEEFEKIKDLEERISKVNHDYSIEITAYVIDATKNKPSASKLPSKHDIYINE